MQAKGRRGPCIFRVPRCWTLRQAFATALKRSVLLLVFLLVPSVTRQRLGLHYHITFEAATRAIDTSLGSANGYRTVDRNELTDPPTLFPTTTQNNPLCYNYFRRSEIGYNLTGRHHFTVLIALHGGLFAGHP